MKRHLHLAAFSAALVIGSSFPGSVSTAAEAGVAEWVAIVNGDTNGDWGIDLSDGIYLLRHLFSGGPEPVPIDCGTGALSYQNGDSNGDGAKDLSDAISLLGWLFEGGASPVETCDTTLAVAQGGQLGPRARVAPVNSRPYGKTYEEWTIEFWKWIMAIPAEDSPFLTPNCTVPQSGNVWFIGGAFGTVPVCSVPQGKSIFFPLAGFVNDFPCPDPDFHPAPGQSLEDFLTEGAQAIIENFTSIELLIDGVPAPNMMEQRVTSRLFTFTGDTSLTPVLDPCITGEPQPGVSDGFWVMVLPLPPGEHILQVTVVFAGTELVTENHVTIEPR